MSNIEKVARLSRKMGGRVTISQYGRTTDFEKYPDGLMWDVSIDDDDAHDPRTLFCGHGSTIEEAANDLLTVSLVKWIEEGKE